MGERRDDVPTKPPPFDPEAYAKASEQRLRAAEAAATVDRKLPSLSAVPRVVMSEDDVAWIELSDAAKKVLARIDGAATVSALMDAKIVGVDDLFAALEELERESVIAIGRNG
jgi:hypothetical protein